MKKKGKQEKKRKKEKKQERTQEKKEEKKKNEKKREKILSDAIQRSFARHGWCPGSFQFSPSVFEDFSVFFIIRIDRGNFPQPSSIVELGFFLCPFLFFSILSGFTNFRPYFRPHICRSGSCLNVCQSHTGHKDDVFLSIE